MEIKTIVDPTRSECYDNRPNTLELREGGYYSLFKYISRRIHHSQSKGQWLVSESGHAKQLDTQT